MQKIPTVFKRDPDDMAHVLPEVNPECQWVLDGEGVATRKYDGTCVMLDDAGDWWSRREVKSGKTPPPNYRSVMTDPVTGKTVGWEPIAQSSFVKAFREAVAPLDEFGEFTKTRPKSGTYELIGPKINGNPEGLTRHRLERHATAEQLDYQSTANPGLDAAAAWEDLRDLVLNLAGDDGWEGIVWHHPDGRMAKLKARDFPKP